MSDSPQTDDNETILPPSSAVGLADVAVFWDYENVRIPEWCPAVKASDCIREKVLPFGRIVERKLYYDSSKPSERNLPRSELDLSGFTLVDCPSRNNKETLDKKLIVDVLFFAWERASRGAKACVVLITSDGDYSYTLARLQDIGVFTIIMFRPDVVAKILIDNANIVMSWEYDVLGGVAGALPPSPVSTMTVSSTPPGRTSPVTLTQLRREGLGIFALFLSCVLNGQQRRLRHDGGGLQQSWGPEASIALEFYGKSFKDKERYLTTKNKAIEKGFVECGRRDLDDPQTPVVKCHLHERDGKSLETYLRLTPLGLDMISTMSRPTGTGEDAKPAARRF